MVGRQVTEGGTGGRRDVMRCDSMLAVGGGSNINCRSEAELGGMP